MAKSAEAFRTISEVSEILDTPAHVLRFWESRFTQVKPIKRAGGRRYYRPADVALLGGIKKLLHEDGITIRGVQKILREQGIREVAALSHLTEGRALTEAAMAAAEGQEEPAPATTAANETPADDAPEKPAALPPRQVAANQPSFPGFAPEAPMHEDAPTLPRDAGEVVPLAGAGADPSGADTASRLRAMDAASADGKRAELRAIYRRLVALRDRIASGGTPPAS